MGYRSSVEVDVALFSKKTSESAKFGSKETTMAIGSTIEKKNGVYRTVDDGKTPEAIRLRLRLILDAFHPGLWTHLPERGVTYKSLGIAGKMANIEQALKDYPAFEGAVAGHGMSVIGACFL